SQVLTVADVARGEEPRWGLRVTLGDAAQHEQTSAAAKRTRLEYAVLAAVRLMPGPGTSGRQILLKMRGQGWQGTDREVADALESLEMQGRVMCDPGQRGAKLWRASEAPLEGPSWAK